MMLRVVTGFCGVVAIAGGGLQHARAAEGGGTTYALGVGTINPGLEPSPPGLTFLDYNTYYTASHLRNSRGGDALPGFHVSVAVTALRVDYTLPDGILPNGVHVGVGVILPVFNQELYTRAPTPNAAGRKVTTGGLGDIGVIPFSVGYIGQNDVLGRYGLKFKTVVVTPSGDYSPSALINRGRNQVSIQPTVGAQVFPKPYISLGANLTYSYNFKNQATNYLSGQELILEPVAEYSPSPGLWLGAQGYYYRQFTGDEQNGREFRDGNFGTALAVGPQVRYATPFHGLQITAKWQHEFGVRNRADGERFWIQLFLHI